MVYSKSIPLHFAILLPLGFAISYWFYKKIQLWISRRNFKKENSCQPVPCYPHIDPIFGLDYWYGMKEAARKRNLLVINLFLYSSEPLSAPCERKRSANLLVGLDPRTIPPLWKHLLRSSANHIFNQHLRPRKSKGLTFN